MNILNTTTALAAGTVRAPVAHGASQPNPDVDTDYWHQLIDESEAAAFLGLARGTVANMRQAGRGPFFVRISSRCVRYRRADLRHWCEAKLRTSTSDPGPAEAA